MTIPVITPVNALSTNLRPNVMHYISQRGYVLVSSVAELKDLARQDGVKFIKRLVINDDGQLTNEQNPDSSMVSYIYKNRCVLLTSKFLRLKDYESTEV